MDGSVRDARRGVDGFSSVIFVYGLSHRSIETTTRVRVGSQPRPARDRRAFDAATSSHRWNDSTRGDVVGWRRRVVSVVCLIDVVVVVVVRVVVVVAVGRVGETTRAGGAEGCLRNGAGRW